MRVRLDVQQPLLRWKKILKQCDDFFQRWGKRMLSMSGLKQSRQKRELCQENNQSFGADPKNSLQENEKDVMDANFIKKHPHIETAVLALTELLNSNKPNIVFLMETVDTSRMEELCVWFNDSSNYVGMLVDVVGCPQWRLTDFYGFPVDPNMVPHLVASIKTLLGVNAPFVTSYTRSDRHLIPDPTRAYESFFANQSMDLDQIVKFSKSQAEDDVAALGPHDCDVTLVF
ncbi:hypothetical protein Goari_018662, partial [Gossypium aridum]|nr:hypothetical protein [Gossypium aridum]